MSVQFSKPSSSFPVAVPLQFLLSVRSSLVSNIRSFAEAIHDPVLNQCGVSASGKPCRSSLNKLCWSCAIKPCVVQKLCKYRYAAANLNQIENQRRIQSDGKTVKVPKQSCFSSGSSQEFKSVISQYMLRTFSFRSNGLFSLPAMGLQSGRRIYPQGCHPLK